MFAGAVASGPGRPGAAGDRREFFRAKWCCPTANWKPEGWCGALRPAGDRRPRADAHRTGSHRAGEGAGDRRGAPAGSRAPAAPTATGGTARPAAAAHQLPAAPGPRLAATNKSTMELRAAPTSRIHKNNAEKWALCPMGYPQWSADWAEWGNLPVARFITHSRNTRGLVTVETTLGDRQREPVS